MMTRLLTYISNLNLIRSLEAVEKFVVVGECWCPNNDNDNDNNPHLNSLKETVPGVRNKG